MNADHEQEGQGQCGPPLFGKPELAQRPSARLPPMKTRGSPAREGWPADRWIRPRDILSASGIRATGEDSQANGGWKASVNNIAGVRRGVVRTVHFKRMMRWRSGRLFVDFLTCVPSDFRTFSSLMSARPACSFQFSNSS